MSQIIRHKVHNWQCSTSPNRTWFRPSAPRVNFNVGIPSLHAVFGCHLVTCNQFGYLLALPLLGSCVSFGVWGLSALPGIGVDIVGGPLLAVGVLSASVGMFNALELVHVMHYMHTHVKHYCT